MQVETIMDTAENNRDDRTRQEVKLNEDQRHETTK